MLNNKIFLLTDLIKWGLSIKKIAQIPKKKTFIWIVKFLLNLILDKVFTYK